MILSYFDENKFSEEKPFFYIGGLMVPENKLTTIEDQLSIIVSNFFGRATLDKETEIHGKLLWHRKGPFKKRKATERLQLLEDLTSLIIEHQLSVRLICIDVHAHRDQYKYPKPEYALGLMLFLERVCDVLERGNEIGLVFGDHEENECAKAIGSFSSFKLLGSTEMYGGRSLQPLKDTIYYTHSHHSRFLQMADVIVFMAQRFSMLNEEPQKWLEAKGWNIWQSIKENTDFSMQMWP